MTTHDELMQAVWHSNDPRARQLRPDKFGVGRTAPRLQADKLVEKPQGTWIRMKTWTHGEPVRSAGPPNDIWFQGVDRLWYWSGAFTDPEPWSTAGVTPHNQPSYEDLMATLTAMEEPKPLQAYKSERMEDIQVTAPRGLQENVHALTDKIQRELQELKWQASNSMPITRPEAFVHVPYEKPTYSRYLREKEKANEEAKLQREFSPSVRGALHSYGSAPEPFDYGYTVDMHHSFGWLVHVGVQTWWRLTEKSAHRKGSSEALRALQQQERAEREEQFVDRRLDQRSESERLQDDLEAFDKMMLE